MEESDSPSKNKTKRRRVQHDPDKKYQCPWVGCDKEYSRAEHLNRHKQNHEPKEVFACEFCPRKFVRQDLRNRHRSRHMENGFRPVRDTKGKYDLEVALSGHHKEAEECPSTEDLERSESTDIPIEPPSTDYYTPAASETVHPASTIPVSLIDPQLAAYQMEPLEQQHQNVMNPSIAIRTSHHFSQYQPNHEALEDYYSRPNIGYEDQKCRGDFDYQSQLQMQHVEPSIDRDTWMQQLPDIRNPAAPNAHLQYHMNGQPYVSGYDSFAYGQPFQLSQMGPDYYHHMNGLHEFAQSCANNMPISAHGDLTSPLTADSSSSMTTSGPQTTPSTPNPGQVRPIFSKQGVNVDDLMRDDAIERLDFANSFDPESLNTRMYSSGRRQAVHIVSDDSATIRLGPSNKPSTEEPPRNGKQRLFEYDLTPQRFDQFVTYITERFEDKQRDWVKDIRLALFKDSTNGSTKFLNLGALKGYLTSFWRRVHPQMPILHQATFATDTCPDLLLAIILALGASTHGFYRDEDERIKAGRFADFLAWHVRIVVIQEPDYDPPAKLWVLQTLILLEIYEKLFSDNLQHHNGISDHAQTVIRMRLGSSLVGRHCISNPEIKVERDSTVEGPGARGTINAAGYNTDDPEWNEWISLEAIKRIAFAAFILDTSHAHMFAHKPCMHIGDIGLFLPCSEKEWLAGSYSQVRAFKKERENQGYKDITFTACLKGLLANKPVPVRTFSFGRAVILAGLLSFSSHAKAYSAGNEDIGVGKPHTCFDKVTRGLKNWERDFEEWYSKSQPQGRRPHDVAITIEVGDDKLTESRTVLFHFAHMAFNGELDHCQIYASPKDKISPDDRNKARTELETWVKSVRASDATFHAVRCLSKLLLPESDTTQPDGATIAAHYSARDDYLFHRPWVIYCAALTIWAYTYFRRNQLGDHKSKKLSTTEEQALHMYIFLQHLSLETSPSNMGNIRYNRLDCKGLLLLLAGKFSKTKWVMLQDAGELLAFCAKLLDEPQADFKVKFEPMIKMQNMAEM